MRAAIVLAAGASRRFGRGDKLAATIGGRRLLDLALLAARRSDARRILIVRRRGSVRHGCVDGTASRTIIAGNAAAGLSESLRAGLAALRPIEREAWIFLGDMPAARARCRIRLRAGEVAARPIVGGLPGHPVLVRASAARRALGQGDRGLGAILATGAIRTWRGLRGDLLDIDDRAALRRARRRLG